MPISQEEKANSFAALHRSAKAFVIPNPWDVASARALAGLGFQALATSSGASAAVLGRRDGEISRDEAIAHARAIAAATDLPVSADLEKGFGDSPQSAAETFVSLPRPASLAGRSKTPPRTNPNRCSISASQRSALPRRWRPRARCRSRSR
jgi:2-methylisocitrate lyase-like PEP mutase family enzyme